MVLWQTVLLVLFFIVSLIVFFLGLKHSKGGNTNGETPWLFFMGAFVWADAVVLGLFWALVMMVVLFLHDWLLFWLIVTVFWMVRSFGEVIYWLNEQFAVKHRNLPEKFWIYRFFPNDSVWFVIQVYWQCVLVASIIASVYLSFRWLAIK